MTRSQRKISAKSGLPDLLQTLNPEAAAAVLRHLLEKHPGLRSEAEPFATDYVSSSSIEEVAQDVYDRVVNIDLETLILPNYAVVHDGPLSGRESVIRQFPSGQNWGINVAVRGRG